MSESKIPCMHKFFTLNHDPRRCPKFKSHDLIFMCKVGKRVCIQGPECPFYKKKIILSTREQSNMCCFAHLHDFQALQENMVKETIREKWKAQLIRLITSTTRTSEFLNDLDKTNIDSFDDSDFPDDSD